jgi:hypothetical protein
VAVKELRWPLLVFVFCLPILIVVMDWRLPWMGEAKPTATPQPVAANEVEFAWLHTTTNSTTWERFISGLMRLRRTIPGLEIDDSRAFLDSTTAIPELRITRVGHPTTVRIRWYKLQNEVTTQDWIAALSQRTPAPVAIIGGGSTDRAIELTRALVKTTTWQGPAPALILTTATADDDGETGLTEQYKDRTFRFCFTNSRMAEAVLDYLKTHPFLTGATQPVSFFSVYWEDDRYSIDLCNRFRDAVTQLWPKETDRRFEGLWRIPFSVGGFESPNDFERQTATDIARQMKQLPADRPIVLILPAIVLPAKRLLQAILDAEPSLSERFVVVTGDGIPVNAVMRDGEFAWPVHTMPVPLLLFTHENPFAWDDPTTPAQGYALAKPNTTEEQMHFCELGRRLITTTLHTEKPRLMNADDLLKELRLQTEFFQANGERQSGTGEHVVMLSQPRMNPTLTVYRRGAGRPWLKMDQVVLSP